MPLAIHHESIMISPRLKLHGGAPYTVALLFQVNRLLLPVREISEQLHAQCTRCSKTELLLFRCSPCSRHSSPLAWGVPSIDTSLLEDLSLTFLSFFHGERNNLFRNRFELCRYANDALLEIQDALM